MRTNRRTNAKRTLGLVGRSTDDKPNRPAKSIVSGRGTKKLTTTNNKQLDRSRRALMMIFAKPMISFAPECVVIIIFSATGNMQKNVLPFGSASQTNMRKRPSVLHEIDAFGFLFFACSNRVHVHLECPSPWRMRTHFINRSKEPCAKYIIYVRLSTTCTPSRILWCVFGLGLNVFFYSAKGKRRTKIAWSFS